MTEATIETARRQYAGADWVRDCCKVEPSPLGTAVADLLGDVFAGIYHLNPRSLKKVDWHNATFILFNLDGSLATYDYDFLTRMVVLCHDRCLRLQIKGKAPGIIELMFHQRERDGRLSHRHPTIEAAVDAIRADYTSSSGHG